MPNISEEDVTRSNQISQGADTVRLVQDKPPIDLATLKEAFDYMEKSSFCFDQNLPHQASFVDENDPDSLVQITDCNGTPLVVMPLDVYEDLRKQGPETTL